MMNIKLKAIWMTLVLGGGLFIYGIGKGATVPLDKVVAVVDKSVITEQELNRKIAVIKRQLGSDNAESLSASILRKRALDELIDTILQLQQAKHYGIQISDKELDDAVTNIAKSNGITVDELKKILPEREGISFSEFRNQLREQGVIQKVQQRVLAGEIAVSKQEINAVLSNPPKMNQTPTQYHVMDVLFEVAEETPKDQVETINNVAKQALVAWQHGTELDEVIQESQSNLKGGVVKHEDLGWRKVDDLPSLFAEKIAAMKVNQVIGPLVAPNGVHLLKLLEMQGGKAAMAKLTRDQAANIAFQRKLMEKIKPWLKELRETAYIKIMP